MDKPELLEAIQRNHPTASIELIKELADKEIKRQLEYSINGMLSKKPLDVLQAVVDYKPKLDKLFGEEVKDVVCADNIFHSEQNTKKDDKLIKLPNDKRRR